MKEGEKRMESVRRRKINKYMIVLITVLMSAILILISNSNLILIAVTSQEIQRVTLTVSISKQDGIPVNGAKVQVFELTDSGLKLLSSGYSHLGVFTTSVQIPRAYKNHLYIPEADRYKDIYASVNVWVVSTFEEVTGIDKTVYIGTRTFQIDPTFLNWPSDSFSTSVVLGKIFYSESETSTTHNYPGLLPDSENYSYTQVVEYSAQDNNMEVWASFPQGSKVDIESKERYYSISYQKYVTDWSSAGSTFITIDIPFETIHVPDSLGRNKGNSFVKFKYLLVHFQPYPDIIVEKVYAADTSIDGYDRSNSPSSWTWDGSKTSNYFTTPQGETSNKPFSATSNFIFSVSVGFSTTPTLTIGLGVASSQLPVAMLNVKAKVWNIQNYVVYTYSLPDSGYKKSFSVWILRS